MRRAFHHCIPVLVFWAVLGLLAGVHLVGHRGEAPPGFNVAVSPPAYEILARIEAKQQVAEAVCAGRETLMEAAAAFKAMDASGTPRRPASLQCAYPGASQDEAYCRMVINWVRDNGPQDANERLVRRLEEELAARLESGTFHLPETASGPAPGGSSDSINPQGQDEPERG